MVYCFNPGPYGLPSFLKSYIIFVFLLIVVKILLDALIHGFLTMRRIALLVIDEGKTSILPCLIHHDSNTL